MTAQTIPQPKIIFNRSKAMTKTDLLARHQQMNTVQGAELSNPPSQETNEIAQLQYDLKLLQLQRDLKQLHARIAHSLREIESLQADHHTMCSSTTDVIAQLQYDLKQLYAENSLTLREIELLQTNHSTTCSLTIKHYIKQKMRQQQFWISQLNQSMSLFVSGLRPHGSGSQEPKQNEILISSSGRISCRVCWV